MSHEVTRYQPNNTPKDAILSRGVSETGYSFRYRPSERRAETSQVHQQQSTKLAGYLTPAPYALVIPENMWLKASASRGVPRQSLKSRAESMLATYGNWAWRTPRAGIRSCATKDQSRAHTKERGVAWRDTLFSFGASKESPKPWFLRLRFPSFSGRTYRVFTILRRMKWSKMLSFRLRQSSAPRPSILGLGVRISWYNEHRACLDGHRDVDIFW